MKKIVILLPSLLSLFIVTPAFASVTWSDHSATYDITNDYYYADPADIIASCNQQPPAYYKIVSDNVNGTDEYVSSWFPFSPSELSGTLTDIPDGTYNNFYVVFGTAPTNTDPTGNCFVWPPDENPGLNVQGFTTLTGTDISTPYYALPSL